jgi:hypothetical protein
VFGSVLRFIAVTALGVTKLHAVGFGNGIRLNVGTNESKYLDLKVRGL